ANFLEHGSGRLVMKRFTESLFFELMGKNAQQVEIAARPHHLRSLAKELDFARSVRDGAVLFVSRSRGKNDVRDLGRFGQKHFLHDEQIEFAASLAGLAKMGERI